MYALSPEERIRVIVEDCPSTPDHATEHSTKGDGDEETKNSAVRNGGAIVPVPKGKTRITIRIDEDLLGWFREQVNAAGGGNYQTMINSVLHEYVESRNVSLEKRFGA